MKRIICLGLIAASAIWTLSCAAEAPPANKANAANSNGTNANTAKPVAAAPTKESLMTMEKAAWEAWKNRDAKWSQENASDKYVGFSAGARQDKAASIKSYEQKCEIKSYSLSDDQMMMLGADVAVLTFRGTQDYTCDGKKGPADVWAASAYIREGDKWKAVFYAETPAIDPKATPVVPPAAPLKPSEAKPDALTEALMAVETKAWESWKTRDAKGMDSVMAKEFMSFGGTGRRDRAESLKTWSETKCEGNGYSFGEPMGVQLSSDVALVTYKAVAEGKCDGKPNGGALWAASFNIKEGDEWKNAFYFDFAR